MFDGTNANNECKNKKCIFLTFRFRVLSAILMVDSQAQLDSDSGIKLINMHKTWVNIIVFIQGPSPIPAHSVGGLSEVINDGFLVRWSITRYMKGNGFDDLPCGCGVSIHQCLNNSDQSQASGAHTERKCLCAWVECHLVRGGYFVNFGCLRDFIGKFTVPFSVKCFHLENTNTLQKFRKQNIFRIQRTLLHFHICNLHQVCICL